MSEDAERLRDEAAIRDVVLRYAHAIDRMDWELLRSCYHPDAIDERAGNVRTAGEFIAWVSDVLRSLEATTHYIANQLVEVAGDVAWMESYCLAYHRAKPGGAGTPEPWFVHLRYCDRLERRNGEWKIAHRIVAYEHGSIDPIEKALLPDELRAGTRDRNDPSYRR